MLFSVETLNFFEWNNLFYLSAKKSFPIYISRRNSSVQFRELFKSDSEFSGGPKNCMLLTARAADIREICVEIC